MKPLPSVQIGALVDLAIVMDAQFVDGSLNEQGKMFATAALNRIFPGQIQTVETCGEECGQGCGECPTQALVDQADAKLTAWLTGRDRPRFLLPGDSGTLNVFADALLERQAQISGGCSPEHDDNTHRQGEISAAAAHYTVAASMAAFLGRAAWPSDGGPITKMARSWPWERTAWKPGPVRRMLIKAIALLIAEVERIDRAEARAKAERATTPNGAAVKL